MSDARTSGRVKRPSRPPGVLRRKLLLARLALIWERAWPLLWLAFAIACVYGALSLFGLWEATPLWLRWAVLAASGLAILFLLIRAVARFSWPSRAEALRRLERVSGFDHRPITAYDDGLAGAASARPEARAIWAAHRKWLAERIGALKVGAPETGMAARDPYHLRFAAPLALAMAFIVAGETWRERLFTGFWPETAAAAATLTVIDAWVSPPAYTGVAPVFLDPGDGARAKGAAVARIGDPAAPITIPEGSELVARIHGGSAPIVQATGEDPAELEPIGPDAHQATLTLTRSGGVEIRRGEEILARWTFAVTPDARPSIAFSGIPGRGRRGALVIGWAAEDDYGLTEAHAELRLATDPDPMSKTQAAPDMTKEPLSLRLALPGLRPKRAEETTYRDLTPHPWAGLRVVATLSVRDEAGQEGFSEPFPVVLPARVFTNPLARAVIEQRTRLVVSAGNAASVADVFDALLIAPEALTRDLTAFLALRVAQGRLRHGGEGEVGSVIELLWDVALRLEDGDLSLAERDLRDARQALADALARDASQEEIEALMQDLREAMQRYLQAMADQARERMARGEELSEVHPDAQMLGEDEFQKMLDNIEEMSKAGANEAARELLAELENMLENLEMGMAPQQQGEGEAAMNEALNELGEIISGQQRLMDETMQEGQRGGTSESGEPTEGQRGRGREGTDGRSGQGGGQRESSPSAQELAEMQERLRRQLGDAMGELGLSSQDIPGALGRADREMRAARDALGEGSTGEALESQSQALDQLRAGAAEIAEALRQAQAQRGQGQAQSDEEGFGAPNSDADPLGRPQASSGPDEGRSVRVPDERELLRAREILEELRRRSGERTRPPLELDYLRRLLERF